MAVSGVNPEADLQEYTVLQHVTIPPFCSGRGELVNIKVRMSSKSLESKTKECIERANDQSGPIQSIESPSENARTQTW